GASQVRGTVRWGGWLPDIDRFDATFFGISPREAACMDPQHRVLMEVAWEALEDAGQAVPQLRGSRTGVFVGISTNDYRRNVMSRASQLAPYWSTGNASCIAANRLSYFFDFKGPSIAVDTACSSSLVAVHWACRSLRAGECDLALAGGVNAILSPDISFSFVKGGGLARDGRCKAFDARADGIVRSEGAGLIVLKPLSRALRDGDAIYAIVRGCAVNQDGRSNGITAPNPAAQEAVIRTAWRDAGKSPAEATYVEAHGAGTPLGDVIEVKALGNALSDGRPPERRCAIGSVKTNVGHCEAAAGIASLIKVALAIKHGQLPPSLHFREPNPGIPFDAMPLFVQQTVAPWPASGGHRLSGVSSFGFGGTNAHVVLDAPPPAIEPPRAPDARPESLHLLPLSAASPAALTAMAERFRQFLAGADAGCSAELAALCATASVRRSHLDHRAAIWTRSHQELVVQLEALAKGEPRTDVVRGTVRPDHDSRVAFVFSGQGGQWPGMHQALYDRFPAFREKINECDRLLRPLADWSLLEQLQTAQPDTDSRGANVETLQVCLFAFQVALAEAWRSWGIVPGAVVGHSMGEVAAACVAGALDLPDALRVMVHRSRLLQQALHEAADGGGMAAIRVSREEAEEFISGYEDRLAIVVENSPRYTVLSGQRDTLQELLAFLRLKKISGRIMNVPGAAHSPQLEPTARKLARVLQEVRPKPERVPFYSTLDGRQIRGTELDAAYWGNSVCRMVRFASAVDLLIDDGYRFFVEIGPHPMLTAAVTQCLQYRDKDAVVVASVRRDDRALDAMLQALGALYASGCDVPWKNVYPAAGRSRVPLPFYPWQRQRCWLDVEPMAAPPAVPTCRCGDGHADEHPLLGREIDLAVQPGLHCWNAPLSVARAPYLRQYQSGEVVVLPLATCLEAIVGAASRALGRHAHVIDQVEFARALTFPPGAEETVQMVLETCGDEARFRCFSRPTGDSWKLHTSGRVRPLGSNGADVRFGPQMTFARDLQARLPETSRPEPNT
ncbi:MAG: type I polyketide synthase, partial [Planctomycetes bacterium]|nr:type I polyketide synthase [Planctomycetota bacterium]